MMREICTRAILICCRRAISSASYVLAAQLSLSSFSGCDVDDSRNQTLETCRSPDNLEGKHRLSASLSSLCVENNIDSHSYCGNRSAQTAITQKKLSSTAYYWPPSSFFYSDDEDNHSQSRVLSPNAEKTISVFWDLDNKPPHSVPPYEAAIRLREVACSFGRLVDMVAYANRHAFSYLPSWVKDERRHRKELDRLEVNGLLVPAEPYVCGYCGRKCRTNMALKKHFKQLHERERNKRLRRLDSLKGKKKIKFKQSLIEKETRYREASRDIIAPKVGYGLMKELKRAGVWVKMASDRPQAADEALMQHMSQSIHMGIQCICLVSDDSDFIPVLHEARDQHLHTVVVGDKTRLKMFADVQFSWADLASGRAFDKAIELATRWYGKDKLGECKGKQQVGSGLWRNTHVEKPKYDFRDWDVSDNSDVESGDVSDVEHKEQSSSLLCLSEDDVIDVLDVDDDDATMAYGDDDDDENEDDKDSF